MVDCNLPGRNDRRYHEGGQALSKPFRFLHTADWQLGLRVRFIPGDAGAEVRNARLKAVRRIGEVAAERRLEAVIAAGDTFEHHGLKPETLRKTFDALAEFVVPVYILPGNHDPHTPDSLFCSELWERECPENVHVLGSTEPVTLREGVHLLPCPLLERRPLEDPTAHLNAEFGPAGGIRVGVAHGGVREILERMGEDTAELVSDVPLDTSERGRLDYLALGDWHSLLPFEAERTWYPGTPEATRFKEKNPGHALVVEIAGPGEAPIVEPVRISALTWTKLSADVDSDEEIEALGERIEAIPDKAMTLVELRLAGTLDLKQRDRLDEQVLGPTRDRFCFVRLRDDALYTVVRDEDLAELDAEGWVTEVVDALREDTTDEGQRALRLLYRLHREVAP